MQVLSRYGRIRYLSPFAVLRLSLNIKRLAGVVGTKPINNEALRTLLLLTAGEVEGRRAEYWIACAPQPLPGYSQWWRFEQAIERAVTSCKESGNPPEHHFADAGKMIGLGKGGQRDVEDYHLSRFACYLIA